MADTASEAVAPSAPDTKPPHPPPASTLSAAASADPSDLQRQQPSQPFEQADRMNVDAGHQAVSNTQDGQDGKPEAMTAEASAGGDDPTNDASAHEDRMQTADADPAVNSDRKPAAQANASEDVDAELEAMKIRLQQMEQETLGMVSTPDGADGQQPDSEEPSVNQLESSGSAAHPQNNSLTFPSGPAVDESTAESDARSVYVGNVDYQATGEELNEYFKDCGTINRVTIMCHKPTGAPKGFAYIEFAEQESVQNAVILNESLFRGRQLKVVEKRTNIPASQLHRGGGYTRGRPRYQRGWRGGYQRRPRGRGRGRGRWAPY